MPFTTLRTLRKREANKAYRAKVSAQANENEVVTLSCAASSPETTLGSTTKHGPALTIINSDTNQTIFQRFHRRSASSSSAINRHLSHGQSHLHAMLLAANSGDRDVRFQSSVLTLGFLKRVEQNGEINWEWSETMEQLKPASIEFLVWVKQLVSLTVEPHLRAGMICNEFARQLERGGECLQEIKDELEVKHKLEGREVYEVDDLLHKWYTRVDVIRGYANILLHHIDAEDTMPSILINLGSPVWWKFDQGRIKVESGDVCICNTRNHHIEIAEGESVEDMWALALIGWKDFL